MKKHLNKRDHFRLACRIPVNFRIHEKDEAGNSELSDRIDGVAVNISGGGLKLSTDAEMNLGDRITTIFCLGEETLFLLSEVRFKYRERDEFYPHHYGVMFLSLSAKEQSVITKYIFKKQTSHSGNMLRKEPSEDGRIVSTL